MTTRTFAADLALSQSPEVEAFWERHHRASFATYQQSAFTTDIKEQLAGIDRYVFLENDKIVSLEEKCDFTTYSNIAIEVESTKGKSPGWINKPIAASVFAYGFFKRNSVYYFPTAALIDLWQEHKDDWSVKYGLRPVKDSNSIVCPIPLTVILPLIPHRVSTLRQSNSQ